MSDDPTTVTGEPQSTADRLGDALEAVGLTKMAERAREGFYDDYRSPLPFPQMTLVRDLRQARQRELADRVMNGEFDASSAEAQAWIDSPEGQDALKAMRR